MAFHGELSALPECGEKCRKYGNFSSFSIKHSVTVMVAIFTKLVRTARRHVDIFFTEFYQDWSRNTELRVEIHSRPLSNV
jgi:hypothetical protein